MRNLKSFINYFYLGILLSLISCSSMTKISKIKDSSRSVVANHVSYDASRRGSLIFKDKNGNQIMLSEPPPDVATKLATDLGANVKITDKVDVSMYMSTTKAIAELGKRTASVNMLRDALYKMSEMSLSKTLDENALKLFEKILTSIENMHKAEMDVTKVDQINAEAEKVKAETEQYLAKGSFNDNEELGARKNYQIAIQLIIDKKLEDAKSYFNAMYLKYPLHFNVKEINEKLIELSKEEMTEKKWKDLYQFIIKDKSWQVDEKLINQLKDKSK